MKNQTMVVILILIMLLILPVSSICGDKKIKATANPVTTGITRGMTVEIPVNIDVSQYEFELGSFTARLEWDNTTLKFDSFEGGRTNGFENPTVNTKGADKGKLVFASAVSQGSKGKVNVLNLKFKVIGKPGVRSAVKLSFTAMAAAKTFENLLPYLDSREIISSIVSIGNNPIKFKLENYPNPFNPTTKISYSLPVAGAVKIVIYNTLGQQVRVLINEEQDAGQYSIEWNSRNDHNQTLSSGVYILRMQAEGFVKDKKLMLLK